MNPLPEDERFLRDLRGASVPVPEGSSETRRAFEEFAHPFLKRFGVDCRLIETLTTARTCDSLKTGGQRYLLFDHGLLAAFGVLDWLDRGEGHPFFTATALQRVFAEAARAGQEPAFYLFLIARALEAAPGMPKFYPAANMSFARFWQSLLVLCHEGAHALSSDHEMRGALNDYAVLTASSMMNEQIAGLTGDLSRMAGLDLESSGLAEAMEEWSVFRDETGVGEEAIFDAYQRLVLDPRFLDEIVCDRFAMLGIQAALQQQPQAQPDEFRAGVSAVLLCVYRTFLHMRMLKYLDGVFARLGEYVAVEKLNPLQQENLLEIGFRGNLVVRLILESARELLGEDYAEELRTALLQTQETHTRRLFEVVNQMLEATALNVDFHRELDELLTADGWPRGFTGDHPLTAFEEADRIWTRVAQGSPEGLLL